MQLSIALETSLVRVIHFTLLNRFLLSAAFAAYSRLPSDHA
jgi:hypothetical protein